MSCLSVSFARIGGLSSFMERQDGDISVSIVPIDDISVSMSVAVDGGTKKNFSCIFKQESGLIVKAKKDSGLSVRAKRHDCGMAIKINREGGLNVKTKDMRSMNAEMNRDGGIDCQMYLVCTIGSREPYLEISPTVVWILAGWTSNDVFSNTHWDID